MENDFENYESVPPIVQKNTAVELKDYFCPFCNFKLFRGNVIEFNMVCSHCNKLVRSTMFSDLEKNQDNNQNKSQEKDSES